MVDFKKRLAKHIHEKISDPLLIYEKLDRDSDKGPLRPAQNSILKEWHENQRKNRDVLLKLHTGQGKTLIGLLMLQSKMNEKEGTAVYLCPNNFLVKQTYIQAEQFGVKCVLADDELPTSFLDGKTILITSVQKFFNGKSKFGIGTKYIPVTSLVLDDSHSCIEAIKNSCLIRLENEHNAYQELINLFENDLEEQGVGTFAEIKQKDYNALLPVPYWAWSHRHLEVSQILSKYSSNTTSIIFAWPLIKDIITDCICMVSGKYIEIAPYQTPLHMFGSYRNAEHRIFMSATTMDDSFLIKDLLISENSVRNPLLYKDEKWSGEKMILIPSLIDSSLTRSEIISTFGKNNPKRKSGIVALCPSFAIAESWKQYGAIIASKNNIENHVENLKRGNCSNTLVVANRYDGIDLPDNSCRVLILDSRPFAESLIERYEENCREGSEIIETKIARTIEQGLGRAVRGEKDYCVVILIDPALIRCIRTTKSRQLFSAQTRMQIEIGLEIAEMAEEDISKGKKPMDALKSTARQSIVRDEGWKEFYIERMDSIKSKNKKLNMLNLFSSEMKAEIKYMEGCHDEAVEIIQEMVDQTSLSEYEKGWYLQKMARFIRHRSKSDSQKYQLASHKKNRFLLKPISGVVVTKISTVSQKRIENIIDWIKKYHSFEDLFLAIDDILTNLSFGVKSDLFERALNDLGESLGFSVQRPDKEWKAGPDNIWAIRDNEYLLFECKSEVLIGRDIINKYETGQMNNSIAWFNKCYRGANVKCILVIPTNIVGSAAGFNEEVEILKSKQLRKLTFRVRAFFMEFKNLDLRDLSEKKAQELIDIHELSIKDLLSKYTVKTKT